MGELERMAMDDAVAEAHRRGRCDPLAAWLLDGLPKLEGELARAQAQVEELRHEVADLEDKVTELKAKGRGK